MEGLRDKIIIFIKFIVLVSIAFFLPKFMSERHGEHRKIDRQVLLGIDNFITHADAFHLPKHLRFALVISDTSPTSYGSQTVQLLENHHFNLCKTIISSELRSGKADAFKELGVAGIDIVLVDMPFSGLSYDPDFLLISNLLELVSKNDKKIVILDRPNPLGGKIEGPGSIPLRPGLTLGELSSYINGKRIHPAHLTVVPMIGWNRAPAEAFISTSNLDFKQWYGYGFLSLFHYISPLDIGMSSTNAYNVFGLPEVQALSEWETHYCQGLCLRFGLQFDKYSYYSEHKKSRYRGMKLNSVKNAELFSTFNSFLTIAKFLSNRKQIALSFSSDFDKIIGSPEVRHYLQGVASFDVLKQNIEASTDCFFNQVQGSLLYSPQPKVLQICMFNGAYD